MLCKVQQIPVKSIELVKQALILAQSISRTCLFKQMFWPHENPRWRPFFERAATLNSWVANPLFKKTDLCQISCLFHHLNDFYEICSYLLHYLGYSYFSPLY